MYDAALFKKLVGPVATTADIVKAGGPAAAWLSKFQEQLPIRMAADQTWDSANYYDRVRIMCSYYVATGSTEQKYLDEAIRLALQYRSWLAGANGKVTANNIMLQGMGLHYALTGEAATKKVIGQSADWMLWPWHVNAITNTASYDGDMRIAAYALRSVLVAHLCGAPTADPNVDPSFASLSRAEQLRKLLDIIYNNQNSTTGMWHYAVGVKPFMAGLLIDALIQYYESFDMDPHIITLIRRAVNYLWSKDWNSTAFCYEEIGGRNPGDKAPDLNNLIYQGFAFDGYRGAEADAILAGDMAGAYWGSGKHFNQQCTQMFNALHYRYKATSEPTPEPQPDPTIAELQARITDLEAQLTSAQSQITSLQSQLTTAESQLTQLRAWRDQVKLLANQAP